MKPLKRIVLILSLLMITACSSFTSSESPILNDRPGSSEDSSEGMMPSFGDADFKGSSQDSDASAEKLIQQIGLEIETKFYAQTISDIEKLIANLGGYIQSSYVPQPRVNTEFNNLVASFTLMIPTSKIDAFILQTGEISNVVSERREAFNVTTAYRDTEARIVNLKAKETRLLELLQQTGSLSDLLMVENELSNTRYEIERLESSIRDFDARIQFTQFNLTIREVYEFTPNERGSLWDRVVEAFRVNAQRFVYVLETSFIFVVSELPFILLQLLLWILPLGLLYGLMRWLNRWSWFKNIKRVLKDSLFPNKHPKD
jgi:hypothetical protein